MTARPYGIAPPVFAAPDGTRLGPVTLQVSSLERSISYYEQVIGLRARAASAGAATLTAVDDDRPLLVLDRGPLVRPARPGAFGLYHFAILVPDRATLGRFAAHARASAVRLAMADHLVSEALYLSDPDGLGIEVYADRPRETWRWQDRELEMSTDPLNAAALMTASGGQPFAGMPRGTTIGHVHLHVGSLAQAEAFYHRALGLEKTVWRYPGALFLAAGGYHHHLGTNVWSHGPAARDDEARLLEWTLVVPQAGDVVAAAGSLRQAGYRAVDVTDGIVTEDPWGTALRVVAATR